MFNKLHSFLGAKYLKDGRSYDEVDCYGLCYLFNKDILNKEIPKYANFDLDQKLFNRVKLGKEMSGDIISFNIKGFPIHVGIIIQKGTMLHIMENSKPIIESYVSSKWKNRINSIWRYESIS